MDGLHSSPYSQSSSPCISPLVSVPRSPIISGTTDTFMFHSFFSSLAKSRYLSFCSVSFNFILWSAGTAKSTILHVLLLYFLWIIIRSGRLAEIKWSICISKSHRGLCRLILQDRCWVLHISFIRMVEFQFLAQFSVAYLAIPVVSSSILFLC